MKNPLHIVKHNEEFFNIFRYTIIKHVVYLLLVIDYNLF